MRKIGTRDPVVAQHVSPCAALLVPKVGMSEAIITSRTSLRELPDYGRHGSTTFRHLRRERNLKLDATLVIDFVQLFQAPAKYVVGRRRPVIHPHIGKVATTRSRSIALVTNSRTMSRRPRHSFSSTYRNGVIPAWVQIRYPKHTSSRARNGLRRLTIPFVKRQSWHSSGNLHILFPP